MINERDRFRRTWVAGVLPCQHLLNALSYKRAEIGITDGFVFRPNRAAVAALFKTAAIVARCGLASVTRLSHVVYWQHFDCPRCRARCQQKATEADETARRKCAVFRDRAMRQAWREFGVHRCFRGRM